MIAIEFPGGSQLARKMDALDDRWKVAEDEIKAVGVKLAAVEVLLRGETGAEKEYLRDERKQLRKKEEQLRDKEKIILELILQRNSGR